jgi:hypothetical protein
VTEPRAGGVLALLARIFAWSVLLFPLWYLAAKPVSVAVASGAVVLVKAATPVERARVRWVEQRIVYEVELDGATTYRNRLPPGAIFELSSNPLRQTFGLPFFLALLLASRPPRAVRRALLGMVVLSALAALGVASEVAVDLGTIVDPAGAALVAFGSVAATLWALGFQLGTLVFPTVVPVMLWVAMDPRYLRTAAGHEGPRSLSP